MTTTSRSFLFLVVGLLLAVTNLPAQTVNVRTNYVHPQGLTATDLAVGGDKVFVLYANEGTLARFDANDGSFEANILLNLPATDIAATPAFVYTANGTQMSRYSHGGGSEIQLLSYAGDFQLLPDERRLQAGTLPSGEEGIAIIEAGGNTALATLPLEGVEFVFYDRARELVGVGVGVTTNDSRVRFYDTDLNADCQLFTFMSTSGTSDFTGNVYVGFEGNATFGTGEYLADEIGGCDFSLQQNLPTGSTQNVDYHAPTGQLLVLSNGTVTGYTAGTGLPLEVVRFSGRASGKTNVINLTSVNETDVARKELLHGTDGAHWSVAGVFSPGEGQREVTSEPLGRVTYYRARVRDLDGSLNYTRTISVTNHGAEVPDIYPNPAAAGSPVRMPRSSVVYDLAGSEVATVSEGAARLLLPAGVYLVKIAGTTEVVKLIVR